MLIDLRLRLSHLEERLREESWAWQDCSVMYDIDTANFLALATRIKQSATAGPPERDKDPPSKYCTDLLAQSGFQSEIWEFYNGSLAHELQSLCWRICPYKVPGHLDEMVSLTRAHLARQSNTLMLASIAASSSAVRQRLIPLHYCGRSTFLRSMLAWKKEHPAIQRLYPSARAVLCSYRLRWLERHRKSCDPENP